MGTLWAVLVWAVFGLIVGAIARLLIPGRQGIGLLATAGLGIVGSLAGGFIAWLISGGEPLQASGWILSIVGAVIVLAVYVRLAGRRHHRI
ncbi:MAG: GlsB/YeaQ/YmgE family stress response membrane protein [Planctomycetaceae bacterium]|nr:GlsB/YeaQ/YmgE family stress response membrane protein [Planctomycetaceae bacterium]